VATGTDGDTVHLTVANTGPIVPTGEVPTLFEPFYRLTGKDCRAFAEAGCGDLDWPPGLGLSIVRSVAHAHGGTAHATARPEGGLVVTVTLPRAPDPM
jgi:signal transduction histidine kinase